MTEPPELDGSHICWIDPSLDLPDPADADPTVRASAVFTSEREKLAAQGLAIVRREQWGASRSYTDARAVTMPAKRFFLHVAVIGSSASFFSRMRLIESIGISRFPSTGVSYNAAVDFDGTLAEAQPLSRRGAHTVVEYAPNKMGLPDGHNANYDSRALVLPQSCPDRVTDQQIDSAARWGAAQIRAGLAVQGAKWYGHRDAAAKACPCDTGYQRIPELQRLTDHYAANGLQPEDWWTMATEADLRAALRAELGALNLGMSLNDPVELNDVDRALLGAVPEQRTLTVAQLLRVAARSSAEAMRRAGLAHGLTQEQAEQAVRDALADTYEQPAEPDPPA